MLAGGDESVHFIHCRSVPLTMPAGLKATSSLIMISSNVTESAPGVFTSEKVDLQLNPLDNEVFVVQAIDIDTKVPELIAATRTESKLSVSSTERTSVGSLANSNVMAQVQIVTQEGAAGAVTNTKVAGETPMAALDYVFILATNDFYLNTQGVNNTATIGGSARLYGYRAKADSATYAALVQSEILSA